VLDRINLLYLLGDLSSYTPLELLELRAVDAVRIFVKDEPHSAKKVAEGKLRLICSVALVDQVIDRLLFTPQNKIEINNVNHIPLKPGLGLNDTGMQALYDYVQTCPSSSVDSADVSGWDWTVDESDMLSYGLKTIDSYKLSVQSFGAILIRARCLLLSRKVFSTSGGELYAQTRYGVMASGSYITSSANTWIAVRTARKAGSPWAMAMGDDLLTAPIENPKEKYTAMGKKLKFYQVGTKDSFEFCSTKFDGGPLGVPLNAFKSIYRLLSNAGDNFSRMCLVRQFKYEYRHSPELARYVKIIEDSGFTRDDYVADLTQEGIEPNPGPPFGQWWLALLQFHYEIGFVLFNFTFFASVVFCTPMVWRSNPKLLDQLWKPFTQYCYLSIILTNWVAASEYPKTVSVLNKMPRDCTEVTNVFSCDVQSPRWLWVSNTMPNKTAIKAKARRTKRPAVKKTKQSSGNTTAAARRPLIKYFGDALRLGGGALGGALGGPVGGAYGHSLGDTISKWLGTGDYKVAANSITKRVANGSPAIPLMHGSGQSIVVRHKEYITDIISSGTANTFQCSQAYALNPGLSSVFPWLSTIAQQFQEYTWKGIVFHYESTSGNSIASTNTSLGTVMMGTQYKTTAPAFTNKQVMLNEYFTSDAKPSESFCHPIECDPKENPYNVQYVRGAAVPVGEDPKTYDLGAFYYASTGMQGTNVNMGELWVTYEVELRKPVVTGEVAFYGDSSHFNGLTPTNLSPWGNGAITYGYNAIGVSATSTTLTFPLGALGNYQIDAIYSGPTVSTIWTPILTNCTAFQKMFNGTQYTCSTLASVGTGFSSCVIFITIIDPTKQATISMSCATLTGASSVDVLVSQLPLTYT